MFGGRGEIQSGEWTYEHVYVCVYACVGECIYTCVCVFAFFRGCILCMPYLGDTVDLFSNVYYLKLISSL